MADSTNKEYFNNRIGKLNVLRKDVLISRGELLGSYSILIKLFLEALIVREGIVVYYFNCSSLF